MTSSDEEQATTSATMGGVKSRSAEQVLLDNYWNRFQVQSSKCPNTLYGLTSNQAAKARSLRDRRTVNVEQLEEATSHLKTGLRIIDPRIELPKRQNLSHSETMELIHARRYQGRNFILTLSCCD